MAFYLKWDKDGERFFETGVDHGVLYVKNSDGTYADGVAWNGLTSISESPEGGEPNALYADNIKYLNLISPEEFNATIEAYTYPKEFGECMGEKKVGGIRITGQKHKQFGLCYRTKIGNDVDGSDHAYKIHLIYNCYATPTEKSYETINDSPDAITFSWEVSTTPETGTVSNKDYMYTHIEIDSRKFTGSNKTKLDALLNLLYGTTSTSHPTLPSLATVYSTLH